MSTLTLTAKKRDLAVKAKYLRAKSLIPCICYGNKKNAMPIQIDYQEFRKIFKNAGYSTVLKLQTEDFADQLDVMVQDVQYHPVNGTIEHVDLVMVDMNKPIHAVVPFIFVGKAAAVTEFGGTLEYQKKEVNIKCLPKDLIHEIEVDVTPVKDFHTSIHLRDIVVNPVIEILDSLDDVIVTATKPKAEEEIKAEETTAATTTVEGATPTEASKDQPTTGAPTKDKE
ncbi:MAG: ribosomal 5S rRNA E-loop binding protein Ctc/L25/TL5, large subunit ribosomal protein L25 [Candidatus Peregrinibacteria bacterium GW2011_GWF2_33_10]|nr:MAG: ribosomal 5S rRNA E-loop binding protein Ctc/L25/TL5, large subunit ribosomal protein L25 [Candidatus Peregrinibacteria bacterium GW2011_GWF2_33_10]